MDIRELLRHLREGQSDRGVARALKVNRKTVKRYRSWAAERGLLEGPLPSLSDLHSLVEATMGGDGAAAEHIVGGAVPRDRGEAA